MLPERDLSPKTPDGPRRILALSGGGIRGIVEVAFLEAVEAAYEAKFEQKVRLCDVFDLVGGTSTGALIATAISLGHPISRIRDFYLDRATKFFGRKRWWQLGRAPMFDCDGLEAEFREDVGDIRLDDPRLGTLLAIVTKRFDTGAPWIINNIPGAPYFDHPPDKRFRGNRDFHLARLLRASTAAPFYFSPKLIDLHEDGKPGVFIDGGMSPYNDPSLALLQLVGLRAFGLQWPMDPERLFILSLGTGRSRLRFPVDEAASMPPYKGLFNALIGLTHDSDQHSLTMMEWMGRSRAPSHINSEVGTLENDTLGGRPLFSYLRLDLPLDAGPETGLSETEAKKLRELADPAVIRPLYERAQDHVKKTWVLEDLLV